MHYLMYGLFLCLYYPVNQSGSELYQIYKSCFMLFLTDLNFPEASCFLYLQPFKKALQKN